MRILVVNAGSTTVKFSLLDGEQELFSSTVDQLQPASAVDVGIEQLRSRGLLAIDAVGHRFVHGGRAFVESVRITPELEARLANLNSLAPLHNPPALEALHAARRLLPDVPHVAAFDTAFHRAIPPVAFTYPVPRTWTEDWGIRKFGFHGLSHDYCSRRAAEMLGMVGSPSFRVIIVHLGGGCSLSAVRGGISIDTTMGFTPMDGLMMGSRSGSIDPGVILHVLRHQRLDTDTLDHALNKESGLLGVSGISANFRDVHEAAANGNTQAQLACDMFAYRVRLGIGAMAASLNGAEAIVFTAGIGENSAWLRAQVCKHLEFLGVNINATLNTATRPDVDISLPDARCRVLVVHTREDVTIAHEVNRVLSHSTER